MRSNLTEFEALATREFYSVAEGEVRPTPLPQRFHFLQPAVSPTELGFLGNYRILRVLGTGGMAYVFEAEDLALQRRVALKVLKPEIRDAETNRRFLREARALAALKHPHIVTVYQAGEYGEIAYLAMELLPGQSLHDWLKQRPPFDLAEILRIGRELADGLRFLHGRGLLHRDIKPANIWLESPHRTVKLLDFGLVRSVDEGARLTEAGLAMGTPGFMSPEQARGEPLDARSDLFSLGCILYQLCVGREPFTGPTTMAVLTALAVENPPPVDELNPQVPPPLARLVARLLEKDPKARIESAERVLDELDRLQRQLRSKSSSRSSKKQKKGKRRRNTSRKLKRVEPNAVVTDRATPLATPRATAVVVVNRPDRKFRRLGLSAALTGGAVLAGVAGASAAAALFWRSPREEVTASDSRRSSETIFLRALPTVARRNWPYYPPPLAEGTVPGTSIEIEGRPSPNGIFMHPPARWGEEASLTVLLDGEYRRFHARVGLADGTPGSESPCTFRVIGDGKELWRSRPVRTPADAQNCVIDVTGVQHLELAVSCSGPSNGAHAVWIEPRVTR